ncbi:MAG: hypothetical protein WAT78_01485 [Rhizobiaceae bacterium]
MDFSDQDTFRLFLLGCLLAYLFTTHLFEQRRRKQYRDYQENIRSILKESDERAEQHLKLQREMLGTLSDIKTLLERK